MTIDHSDYITMGQKILELTAQLAHANRVIDKARDLCNMWPPSRPFPAELVATEVELAMLIYGYDHTSPPPPSGEGGK